MKRLIQKFNEFMRTRYGMDKLNLALLISALMLAVLGNLFKIPHLSLPILLLYVLFCFRFFSTSIYKRNSENNKFLQIFASVKSFFKNQKRNAADKDHVYRSCPHCNATVRLPKKKGKHSVRCPKCSSIFDVNIH